MKPFLALLVSVCAYAATTTVTGSIVGPDGQPVAGTALIRISRPCGTGAAHVADKTIAVKFAATASNFSVALVPNDAGDCANTHYTMSITATSGTAHQATLVVPTSASPVSLDSVRVDVAPVDPTKVKWAQIIDPPSGITSTNTWAQIEAGMTATGNGLPSTKTWAQIEAGQ